MSGLTTLESSRAPSGGSKGSAENMYENELDLSPPSPRSLSEVAPPYSPIGAYPPPVKSPGRFPPPPNSGFAQTYPLNMIFFEGQPTPRHSFDQPGAEPGSLYDHWPESSTSTVSGCGLDNSTKCFTHWSLPSANYVDSKYDTVKSEPLHPTIATTSQYPLSDSRSKPFVPRFSSSAQDYHSTVSPNAMVQSTSSASVSSPHFSSASTRTARPHFSGRFSFNPHASAFYPGMYSQTSYGPGEDFSLYYEPSYVSHLAPTDFLSNSYQGVDSFHDASSRPVHSPETAPRPISSTAPSFFSGVHSFSGSSATFSNPPVAPQPVCSRTDYCGLTSSSDGSGVRESSFNFPPLSSLSFNMPIPGTSVFAPYDTVGTLESAQVEDDEMMERILKESGSLLYYHHISPEEWRWNMYEAQDDALNVEGLVDLADCTSGDSRSAYNYFQGVDRIGPSCVSEAVSGDSTSLFALSILERSKFQNQGGPSLKLAASALAEMLATSSTAQSVKARIASSAETAPSLPMDLTFPVIGDSVEAPELSWLEDKSPDDCCSSSGSVVTVKEANRTSPSGGTTFQDPHCPQTLENERTSVNSMRVDLAIPDESGRSQNSSTARTPTTVLSVTLPQFGPTRGSPARREFVSGRCGGALKATDNSTALSLENVVSENPKPLLTQPMDVSPCTYVGTNGRLNTQSDGAVSSRDDDSVAGPLRANVTTFGPSTSGPCHDVGSSRIESHVPLRACKSFDSPRGSVLTAIHSAVSQAHADPPFGSAPTMAEEVAAKLLASFNLLGPRTVNKVQTEPTHSGLQSLTTSISNLTKVLIASHSSSFSESDIAPIQESLQFSILGLSHCLLKQAKAIQASNCIGPSGLKNSAPQEQVNDDCALENSGLKWLGEAQDDADEDNLKSSIPGPSEVRPCPDAVGFELRGLSAGDDKAFWKADESQRTPILKENLDGITEDCAVLNAVESAQSNSVRSSEPKSTCQLQMGEINDVLDYLRQQGVTNLVALRNLIGAEEREKELRTRIQDLTEQLEFEREERVGAAYLCKAIVQESDVQRSKLYGRSISSVSKAGVGRDTPASFTSTCPVAVLEQTQPSRTGGIADHFHCEDGPGELPQFRRGTVRDDNESSSSDGKEVFNQTEIYPTDVSSGVEYSSLDGVATRLALLLSRRGGCAEENVLTGTGTFNPENPGPSNLKKVYGEADGSSSPEFHDGHFDAPSRRASQILKRSQVLFNMDAAWNKCYDFEGSQHESVESTEVEDEDTQSHIVTQAYDTSLSIDGRALIIRSRSRCSGNDGMESGDEIAGGVVGSSQGDSQDRSNSQDSWLETVPDGSDAYLRVLVHSDVGDYQQAVAQKSNFGPERENEVECFPELLRTTSSHKEAGKIIIQSLDSEEESGWEHVRLPRQISK